MQTVNIVKHILENFVYKAISMLQLNHINSYVNIQYY